MQLTDAQATKAHITENLTAMVDGAKAGNYSYFIFSFSSHGTQVSDVSGDEPDRASEAFRPHELAQKGSQWDSDLIIIDDEVHDPFVQLPESVLLETDFDTSQSGTGLKAIGMLLTRRPRYLPPPSPEAFEQVEGAGSRGLHSALIEKGITHHILWAVCRADRMPGTQEGHSVDGDARMKYNLVFEGGGAKGMVFVGAIEEFFKRGNTFDRLLGTSAGATTATLLAVGYTPADMLGALTEKENGKSILPNS